MAPVQAGLSLVIIAVQHNLGRREVLDISDACGGISHILARANIVFSLAEELNR
jgi:hypothetical protein